MCCCECCTVLLPGASITMARMCDLPVLHGTHTAGSLVGMESLLLCASVCCVELGPYKHGITAWLDQKGPHSPCSPTRAMAGCPQLSLPCTHPRMDAPFCRAVPIPPSQSFVLGIIPAFILILPMGRAVLSHPRSGNWARRAPWLPPNPGYPLFLRHQISSCISSLQHHAVAAAPVQLCSFLCKTTTSNASLGLCSGKRASL